MWEKEQIPAEAKLFCYVHKTNINKDGLPKERAFRNTPFDHGTDLSSDWNKYSTPQETRARLSLQEKSPGVFKNPDDYFIVEFLVEDILSTIPDQEVEHDPIYDNPYTPDNRSHTKIIGDKDVEVRLKMVDICEWVIPPNP